MNVVIPSPLRFFQRLAGLILLVYISATMMLAGLIVLIWVILTLVWSSLRIRWQESKTWKKTKTRT